MSDATSASREQHQQQLPPPMPLLTISSPETIQKCASLSLRPNDIFICSYPKSGTTWMQHIVLSLIFHHQQQQQQNDNSSDASGNDTNYNHVSEYAPFFEIDPHWEDDNLVPWIQDNHERIGRRIFNTHLRFDMLPKPKPVPPRQQQQQLDGNDNKTTPLLSCGKFLYILRSPLDVCVSFYHHLSNQVEGGYEGSFDDFFQQWLQGDIPFGSWLDHVQSYTSGARAEPRRMVASSACDGTPTSTTAHNTRRVQLADGRDFFFVTYEELSSNLPAVVADLRDFLDLGTTNDIDNELLETFSFANMKANRNRFQPKSVQWKNNFSFLRKGVPGDAATVVTTEQGEQFQTALEAADLWQRLEDESDESAANKNTDILLSRIKPLVFFNNAKTS